MCFPSRQVKSKKPLTSCRSLQTRHAAAIELCPASGYFSVSHNTVFLCPFHPHWSKQMTSDLWSLDLLLVSARLACSGGLWLGCDCLTTDQKHKIQFMFRWIHVRRETCIKANCCLTNFYIDLRRVKMRWNNRKRSLFCPGPQL